MTEHQDALLDAADTYLNLGLRVIALTGKAPNGAVHPNGLYNAFVTGHAGLKDRFTAFHHPNTTGIGILTGMPYFVVDIDGEEGAEQWRDLVGDEFIPDRWVARTGRGLHLWVAHYEAWPTAKLGAKLDFKGEGGYVAAPPSLHPDGHQYEWLLEPDPKRPPMEMPTPLYDDLVARRFERERKIADKQVIKRLKHVYVPGSGEFYANTTSFDGIIDKVRKEPEGNRNGVLYWAARSLIEEGAEPEDMENLLNAAIDSGLARSEARRTIRSAIDAGE